MYYILKQLLKSKQQQILSFFPTILFKSILESKEDVNKEGNGISLELFLEQFFKPGKSQPVKQLFVF